VVRDSSSLLGLSLPECVVKRAIRRAPSSGNAAAGFGLPLPCSIGDLGSDERGGLDCGRWGTGVACVNCCDCCC
jgi:hypothetical protein